MGFLNEYESQVLHDETATSASRHLLVYFLTGNPGVTHFYKPFLETLLDLHSRDPQGVPHTALHIYSTSLAGFETDRTTNPKFVAKHGQGPYSVEQEVDFIDTAIDDAHSDLSQHLGEVAGKDLRVVLIGHSLGTYMALEVLARRKRAQSPIKIISAILLCPTIMNLAGSPNGTSLLGTFLSSRFATSLVPSLTKLIFALPPSGLMQTIIQRVSGQETTMAKVTSDFLKSPSGFQQTLYLAQDELVVISTDKWDDEIWGIVKADAAGSKTKTKMFLYFLDEDTWIANETRDQIIAARASTGKVA
ncbi:UBP9-binding protein bun107 [Sphaceloma murrayae]|uniref:UBP9-binding protein bun107 n=1 Tax=Sphaceloma murrayae TaxID=2082308 RepID=A0A2K1QKL5_9PEZI|nr:UBP9-binding protein bun107 [Sphaceloma murrayae]